MRMVQLTMNQSYYSRPQMPSKHHPLHNLHVNLERYLVIITTATLTNRMINIKCEQLLYVQADNEKHTCIM